jgi:hypothetical protein
MKLGCILLLDNTRVGQLQTPQATATDLIFCLYLRTGQVFGVHNVNILTFQELKNMI